MTQDVSERLLLARQLRALSQIEACRRIGISQSVLSKVERGITSIDEESLVRCANAYDLPLSFFKRRISNAPAGHFYYRRKLTISERDIAAFEAKVRIFQDIIDNIMEEVEIPEYTFTENLIGDTPEETAQKVRYALGIYRGAIPNLTTLIENSGVIVVRLDFGTDKIDGTTTITPKGYKLMFINSTMPNDRVRFSTAHELGHLLLHLSQPPHKDTDVEEEADRFASELLMPAAEIRQEFSTVRFDELAALKRKWGVSMRALVRRARDVGFIDDKRYRNMQFAFSKRGYNKSEPVALPIETPTLLPETLHLLQSVLGYSLQELCQQICIHPSDYRAWFGSHRPKIVPLFT